MQKQKIIWIFGLVVVLLILVILVGIYKFDYLSGKDGYDVDGNKIQKVDTENELGQKVKQEKESIKENLGVKLISPAEFKEKIETGEYVLVDIRTPEEYQSGHIEGAINIDYYAPDFKEQVSQLDRNKKYLYYCRSGHRSGEAEILAKTFNFSEVYELDGGINAWQKVGFQVKK